MPPSVRPLRFLINPASGGGRGARVAAQLAAAGHGGRIHALSELDAAVRAAADEGGAVVAAGGDGTAASALAATLRLGLGVPVGVLPLGTGNDLARVCGWGARCVDPVAWAAALAAAVAAPIDGWRLDGGERFFLYLSCGADARVARRFHAARQRHRRWFLGPAVNQLWYGLCAVGETHAPVPVRDLARPPSTAALLFANVPSYAGGCCPGRGIAAADGRLDVFALPPGLRLGLMLSGLRRLRPLGAHATWRFTCMRPLSVQLDGEPRLLSAGAHVIDHAGRACVLMRPGAATSPGLATVGAAE